ncbi:unnamed protein product [Toxocara canis]|uniref:HARP domain-containing protein n=1 Tax=Toxocara canis TaxID=6265 RepID=A0A183VAE2_TOXCA|nr:unnamed protein product [Toxocara canis]
MTSLTEEQRARIARNKAEADRRRALHQQHIIQQQQQLLHIAPSTSVDNGTASVTSRATAPKTQQFKSSSGVQPTAQINNEYPSGGKVNVTYASDVGPMTSAYGKSESEPVKPFPPRPPINSYMEPSTLQPFKTEVTVTFTVIDERFFGVVFTPFHRSLVAALKEVATKRYDPVKKQWCFPINDVAMVEEKLHAIKDADIVLHGIPRNALRGCSKMADSLNDRQLESAIDKALVDALFPFQRRGVWYVGIF